MLQKVPNPHVFLSTALFQAPDRVLCPIFAPADSKTFHGSCLYQLSPVISPHSPLNLLHAARHACRPASAAAVQATRDLHAVESNGQFSVLILLGASAALPSVHQALLLRMLPRDFQDYELPRFFSYFTGPSFAKCPSLLRPLNADRPPGSGPGRLSLFITLHPVSRHEMSTLKTAKRLPAAQIQTPGCLLIIWMTDMLDMFKKGYIFSVLEICQTYEFSSDMFFL